MLAGSMLAISAALSFSLGSLCVRNGNDHIDRNTGLVFSLVANVALVGSVTLVTVLLRGLTPIDWTAVAAFAAAGLSSSFLARWAYIGSIFRLGPSRAGVAKNIQPVLTVLLAVWLLGEQVSLEAGAAGALVVVGAGLSSTDRAIANKDADWAIQAGRRVSGVAFAFMSAGGYAIANIFRKSGLESWDEPLIGATIGVLAAASGSIILQRGGRKMVTQPKGGVRRRGITWFVIYGSFSGIAQICIFFSLRLIDVWVSNLFVCTEPALTAMVSWLIYRGRERFTAITVFSILAVVVGSVWMLFT